MIGTTLGVLGGLLLVFLGGVLIGVPRASIEQTLLVKLSDDGLGFHARLHTPRDALNEFDEGSTLIYMWTSDVSKGMFIAIKGISVCLLTLGLATGGRSIPPLADRLAFVDAVIPWFIHIALALAFIFMALVFLKKREDVADALSVLRVNPLGGLADTGKNSFRSAIAGDNPLDSLVSETAGRAVVTVTPVRAWAVLVPIFALATASELVLAQILR